MGDSPFERRRPPDSRFAEKVVPVPLGPAAGYRSIELVLRNLITIPTLLVSKTVPLNSVKVLSGLNDVMCSFAGEAFEDGFPFPREMTYDGLQPPDRRDPRE
jgi:hypothetical protein